MAATGTTLTRLLGVGDVLAANILARTGPISRFPSAAAFASFCGVAPIEVSSGEVVRHRLSRAGDRQLNYALQVMAMTQIRHDSPWPGLLPTQTRRREKPQRGAALPQTLPRRRRLPRHDQGRDSLPAAGRLTKRGAV